MQDNAQQTHQVLMLHLRHHCRLVQEGLGGHVTLDILHGHLLAQVLALQDRSELTLSNPCAQRQMLQVQ